MELMGHTLGKCLALYKTARQPGKEAVALSTRSGRRGESPRCCVSSPAAAVLQARSANGHGPNDWWGRTSAPVGYAPSERQFKSLAHFLLGCSLITEC